MRRSARIKDKSEQIQEQEKRRQQEEQELEAALLEAELDNGLGKTSGSNATKNRKGKGKRKRELSEDYDEDGYSEEYEQSYEESAEEFETAGRSSTRKGSTTTTRTKKPVKKKTRETAPTQQAHVDTNTGPVVQQESLLTALPLELFSLTLTFVAPKDFLSLMLTCKAIFARMDPRTDEGKFSWKRVRETMHFPDPSAVNLTDFQFFRQLFGRGCNFCNTRPQTRKPYWEFGGHRICKDCYTARTVRSYLISGEYGREAHNRKDCLPRRTVSGYSYRGRGYYGNFGDSYFEYEEYWREDVARLESMTQAQLDEARQKTKRIGPFVHRLDVRLAQLEEEKRVETQQKMNARKNQVTQFLRSHHPEYQLDIVSQCESFLRATSKTGPFVKSSQTALMKSLPGEYAVALAQRGRSRLKEYLVGVCRTSNPRMDYYNMLSNSKCTEILESITYIPTESECAELVRPLIEAEQEQIAAKLAIQRRQTDWLDKYILNAPLPAEVVPFKMVLCQDARNWKGFMEVDPQKENEFKSYVDELISDLHKNITMPRPEATARLRQQIVSKWGEQAYEVGQTQKMFYCTNCRFCRNVGATVQKMAEHFAQTRCTIEQIGRK